MTPDELRHRTRSFALEVVRFTLGIGTDEWAMVARRQLIRAATGVATNHRAATRARSRREFAARLAVVVEEADESELWLDFLHSTARGQAAHVSQLRNEAVQLRAIFAAARTTCLAQLKAERA